MISITYLFEIDIDNLVNPAKFAKKFLPSADRSEYIDNLRKANDADESDLIKKGWKVVRRGNIGDSGAYPFQKAIQTPNEGGLLTKNYTGSNEIIRQHEHNEAKEFEKHGGEKIRKLDKDYETKNDEIYNRLEKSKKDLESPGFYKTSKYSDEPELFKQMKEKHKEIKKEFINHEEPKWGKNYYNMGNHFNDNVLKKEHETVSKASEKFGGIAPIIRFARHKSGEYDYIKNPNSKTDISGKVELEDLPEKTRKRVEKFRGGFLKKLVKPMIKAESKI